MPIGSSTYVRIEKDSSISLLNENGRTTSVKSNGGCNSEKSNINTLLSKRIKDLNLAYKVAMTVDPKFRFSDKLESIEKTLEACKKEESESSWYKEAMADTKKSDQSIKKSKPAIQ